MDLSEADSHLSDEIDEEQFRRLMEKAATTTRLKPVAPDSSFDVKQHRFIRGHFEGSPGTLR